MIQEKIESSILNGLEYIGRLEKKSGNKIASEQLESIYIKLQFHNITTTVKSSRLFVVL